VTVVTVLSHLGARHAPPTSPRMASPALQRTRSVKSSAQLPNRVEVSLLENLKPKMGD
jgi:hypothetical protein